MKMLMENWNQFVNEEMSQEDEEMSLEDLIDQLTDEQIASAVKNWAKGGKHTMDDLHMHLGKKMQDLGGKPKTRGGSIMGLYAPDVFEEGEELEEEFGFMRRVKGILGMEKDFNYDTPFLPYGGRTKDGRDFIAIQMPKPPIKANSIYYVKFENGDEEEISHSDIKIVNTPRGKSPLLDREYGSKVRRKMVDAGVMPSLDEEKLTKAMKKEKEKVVKGMKKNKKDFKKRYGDDAESVMYATATKIAKEKN